MTRFFLDSYLLVIILSLVISMVIPDFLWGQQLLGVLWAMVVIMAGIRATRRGRSLWQVLRAGLMSQLGGIVVGIYAFVTTIMNYPSTWAEGILEIWIYPTLVFTEKIKLHLFGEWSIVYLLSCFLPIVLGIVPTIGIVSINSVKYFFGYDYSVREKHR